MSETDLNKSEDITINSKSDDGSKAPPAPELSMDKLKEVRKQVDKKKKIPMPPELSKGFLMKTSQIIAKSREEQKKVSLNLVYIEWYRSLLHQN